MKACVRMLVLQQTIKITVRTGQVEVTLSILGWGGYYETWYGRHESQGCAVSDPCHQAGSQPGSKHRDRVHETSLWLYGTHNSASSDHPLVIQFKVDSSEHYQSKYLSRMMRLFGWCPVLTWDVERSTASRRLGKPAARCLFHMLLYWLAS